MSDRVAILAGIVLLVALAAVLMFAFMIVAHPGGGGITFAATSTGSDTLYLFVTGPNLPQAGGRLEDPDTPVRSGDSKSFTRPAVDDGCWTYRWRTGMSGLDPGTYIVYAVDAPLDRSDLPDLGYTTFPFTLGTPPADTLMTETTT